jgi:hypothetical protein
LVTLLQDLLVLLDQLVQLELLLQLQDQQVQLEQQALQELHLQLLAQQVLLDQQDQQEQLALMVYFTYRLQHQLDLYKVRLGMILILASLTYGTMTALHNSGLNLAIMPWVLQDLLELLALLVQLLLLQDLQVHKVLQEPKAQQVLLAQQVQLEQLELRLL